MSKTLKKYRGVIVPMVTPIDNKGHIDKKAVETICHSFVDAGVDPFLLGTTGESFSVSIAERKKLVSETVKAIAGRKTVYAGISANCFDESVEQAKLFADQGVDVLVAHQPFYFPMDDSQLLLYFEKLADTVELPLILYNNPITTKQSIPLQVIDKLSHHPDIYGFKDSERGADRLNEAIALWRNRTDFSHLLGWAAQSANALLQGSDGIIPSTGNIVPLLYARMYEAALQNDAALCHQLQAEADEISLIYQKDRNVSQSIPALKCMMGHLALCQPHVLLPMVDTAAGESAMIKAAMDDCSVLKKHLK